MSATETATVQSAVCTTSDHISHFVDVISGEVLDEDEVGCFIDCDAEGHPLAGSDEMGVWWGTERAVWVLSQQYYTVEVWGWMGPDPYIGHFLGTEEEVRHYCETHGVKVDLIQSGR